MANNPASELDPVPTANQGADRYADSKAMARAKISPTPLPFGEPAHRFPLHPRWAILSILTLVSLLLLSTTTTLRCAASDLQSTVLPVRSVPSYARAAGQALLEVFQVYPPVLTVSPAGVLEITDGSSNPSVAVAPSRTATCQETLVVYNFGSSYGHPYVGPYTPPSCDFNRVTWNLTVLSSGRQYDRLGSVSFGDIELLRTSTAEPTAGGIEWTYVKDMTNFLPLFKQDQTIIFDIDNVVTDVYTGYFNVTLTAAFFTADDSIDPADLIIPISKRQGAVGQPSFFSVPNDTASNDVTLPRNVKKAVFTVSATGQSHEEFWWSNVLQSEINTFPAYGTLYGYSPFREVQLYIDGSLAGVAWPYPIIFTGGVVPGLWRPIVGIDAFDLREDEIDITPWLPLLCDGKAHNFAIRISGLNDNGNGAATLSETTTSYWWVSGKVFIWLDSAGHITTGDGPYKNTPNPDLQVSSQVLKTSNGTNETLLYQVTAQRSLSFHSTLHLSSGNQNAFWSQTLSYSNTANFTDNANFETNIQLTSGHDLSSSGYARKFSYPLYAYSTYAQDRDNFTLTAVVNRVKDTQILGQPVYPTGLESFSSAHGFAGFASAANAPAFQGAWLSTSQNGSATYVANQTSSSAYGFGSTVQDMTFSGLRAPAFNFPSKASFAPPSSWPPSPSSGPPPYGFFPPIARAQELFHRHVMAVNASVVEDEASLLGANVPHSHPQPSAKTEEERSRGWLLEGFPGRGQWGQSRFSGRGGARGGL